jgi:rhodanese-related sulfurtransferase
MGGLLMNMSLPGKYGDLSPAAEVILEVDPQAAFEALSLSGAGQGQNSALLDVRCAAEWSFVGQPDLGGLVGAILLSVEWQTYPGMQPNPAFLANLSSEMAGRHLTPDTNLYVLCRSGARSLAAAKAIISAGLAKAINITGGFEGDLDKTLGHRGHKGGWKAAGLPWRQS